MMAARGLVALALLAKPTFTTLRCQHQYQLTFFLAQIKFAKNTANKVCLDASALTTCSILHGYHCLTVSAARTG